MSHPRLVPCVIEDEAIVEQVGQPNKKKKMTENPNSMGPVDS